MDLSKLDTLAPAESGTVVELEHPVTGEPIPDTSITLRGEDSHAVRNVIRKQHDRRIEKMRKGKGAMSDSASLESEQVEKLVAATIDWKGIELDGEPLPFSAPNARKLYSDPRFPWLVEQVQTAMLDRERFFTNGSKS